MQPFFEEFPLNSGRLAFCPPFPTYIEDIVLAGNHSVAVPIPPGALFAVFSFDGDIRVKLGGAATAFSWPDTPTLDGTGSELNPTARRLPEEHAAMTHLCILSGVACTGSVSFYR